MSIRRICKFLFCGSLLASISGLSFSESFHNDLIYMYDGKTGCLYIRYKDTIIPRLNSNGGIMCKDLNDNIETLSHEKATFEIDNLNGCQYVVSPLSKGITPRLNKENKIICSNN